MGSPTMEGSWGTVVNFDMKLLEFQCVVWRDCFSSFGVPSPISRKQTEEECPPISRGVAKKSTVSYQNLQKMYREDVFVHHILVHVKERRCW